MKKEILLLGELDLYQKSEPVRENEFDGLPEIERSLSDTLMDFRRENGSGRAIAAPQIGIFKRIIYMHIDRPVLLVNPILSFPDEKQQIVWDDCMSIPNLEIQVSRYQNCKVEFRDRDNQKCCWSLSGGLAELIQHEYDHLDGILATMRAMDKKEFSIQEENMKRIGLLGGVSAMSTIEYYRLLTLLYYEKFQNHNYPEIIINSLNFGHFTELENRSDSAAYIAYICEGIQQLERAGADFIAMTANSPHSVYKEVCRHTGLPLVSIVDVVLDEIIAAGLQKILLTGIRHTMQSTFYQKAAADKGLTIVTPDETRQNHINQIIFDELSIDIIKQESRCWLADLVEASGCEGVILGCTELPLLLDSSHTSKAVFNSTKLHCRKILDLATAEEESDHIS